VAAAILMILMVALMASFARSAAGFQKAQIETLAQNLAEFQAEDLKSMAPSVLNELVEGKYPGKFYKYDALGNLVLDGLGNPVIDTENPLIKYSNYPYATADTSSPTYDAAALANDQQPWMYDSGEVQTDFNLIGITKVSGEPWVAGDHPSSAPTIPDGTFLLGTNVEILPYADSGTTWKYYRVVLHKEAYPLFTKRIRIERINAAKIGQPTDPDYHDYNTDSGTVFSYTISIRYKQGTAAPILISTSGTIASPYAVEPTTIGVVSPAGSASWTKGQPYPVTWTVTGDVSGIYAYRVSFSSDDGQGYGAPLAVILHPGLTATVTAPSVDTGTAVIKVDAVSSSGRIIATGTSADFTVGAYVPPASGSLTVSVTDPATGTVWTSGASQTVSWSVGGVNAVLAGFRVSLSTGGGDYVDVASTGAGARTATVTAGAASASCIIKVTAVNGTGGSITSGSSPAFTTLSPLTLTVVTPAAGAVWTRNMSSQVTWSLSRSEASIVGYRIDFFPGATATVQASVAGGSSTSGSIAPDIASNACRIVVSALNSGGSVVVSGTSGQFAVVAPLTITVNKPNGSSYDRKTTIPVEWTTNGNSAGVTGYNVYLSVDGGSTWSLERSGVDSPTTVTLPNTWDVNGQVKVVAVGSVYTPAPVGLSPLFLIKKF
jgi:hypothetical protein